MFISFSREYAAVCWDTYFPAGPGAKKKCLSGYFTLILVLKIKRVTETNFQACVLQIFNSPL